MQAEGMSVEAVGLLCGAAGFVAGAWVCGVWLQPEIDRLRKLVRIFERWAR
jgi:hypothetical protein